MLTQGGRAMRVDALRSQEVQILVGIFAVLFAFSFVLGLVNRADTTPVPLSLSPVVAHYFHSALVPDTGQRPSLEMLL